MTPHTSCGHQGEVSTDKKKKKSPPCVFCFEPFPQNQGHPVYEEVMFLLPVDHIKALACLCVRVSELLPHEEAERLNDVKFLVQQLYTTLRIEDHQLSKERELIGRLEDLNSQLRPLEKV